MVEQDMSLLERFAREGSQDAFARLVERHADWVYSMSVRLVRDKHLAEDVAQSVFILLASKAKSIGKDVKLTGFLFRACRYCALNALDAERARARREAKAAAMKSEIVTEQQPSWSEFEPMLDEGVNRLRRRDRQAILLRFYEGRSLRDVGDALGISEEAAAKRVSRAVNRLKEFFNAKGAVVPSAALGEMLIHNVVGTAPASFKTALASSGLTTTAAGAAGAIAKGAAMAMAIKKTSSIVVAVVLLLVAGAATVAVRTFSSPAPSTPASIPAPTTSPASVGFHLTFADGSETEIIAIGRDPRGKNQWWLPDGTPLTRPPFSNPIGYVAPPENQQIIGDNVLVVVTRTRVPAKTNPLDRGYGTENNYEPPNPQSLQLDENSFSPEWNGKQIINPPHPELLYYPNMPSQIVLQTVLTNGPWEVLASYPAGGASQNFLNASFSTPQLVDGHAELTVSYDNFDDNEMQVRIDAVLKNKVRVRSWMGSAQADKRTFTQVKFVEYTPEQIDRYELLVSPRQHVKFPPFPTQPGNQTPVDPEAVLTFRTVKGE